MPYDQGTGVTLTQRFDQLPHGCLLFCRTRVVGLTADVEPALVADADRMGVVVQTVGADHPFRATGLDRSVTTDHVVVANAKLIMAVFAMIPVDLTASSAMILPISTPPNALAFSTNLVQQKDMSKIGFIMGMISMVLGFGLVYLMGIMKVL